MKKYIDFNNEIVFGENNLDIVRNMRDSSRFASQETEEEFMTGYASRLKMTNSKIVRTDNADNFVADLLLHKVLKIVE